MATLVKWTRSQKRIRISLSSSRFSPGVKALKGIVQATRILTCAGAGRHIRIRRTMAAAAGKTAGPAPILTPPNIPK